MTEVELMWCRARDRVRGIDLRRPGAGNRAVLIALLDGPGHGAEVARRAGQSQPNVTSRWLPKLERYGFVTSYEAPGRGRPERGQGTGGGRMPMLWKLTKAGRSFAEALRAEEAQSDVA